MTVVPCREEANEGLGKTIGLCVVVEVTTKMAIPEKFLGNVEGRCPATGGWYDNTQVKHVVKQLGGRQQGHAEMGRLVVQMVVSGSMPSQMFWAMRVEDVEELSGHGSIGVCELRPRGARHASTAGVAIQHTCRCVRVLMLP